MSTPDHDLTEREEPALEGVERDVYDAVSEEEPWALVERFAELERVSGSEDERAAADYLAHRLDAFGIDHEVHFPELYISVPEDASLTAEGESFDAVKTVAFGGGEAGKPSQERGANGLGEAGSGTTRRDGVADGELRDVGGGAPESEADLLSADLPADLDDCSGDVVLLDGILPLSAIQELEAAGAEAVIVVHPHEREPHEGIATPVWGGAPEPGEEGRIPSIPVLTVAKSVGARLRELGDGADVALTAETETGWVECPLVEARIPGAADPEDDDFVLLHGHYDSWHEGVTDNATGDAALLELARVFHEHRDDLTRDLRVCWWPAHSTGRYAGSTWYAEAFAQDLDERCVAHVNCDSPGAVDATEFRDMVCWLPEADALCRGAIDDVCGKATEERRPPRAGDYSFDNLGLTGLFMLSSNIPAEIREARGFHAVGGSGGHSDAWHVSTDTIDKADPEVLVRDIRVYATAVTRLLTADVLPLDFRHTLDRHEAALADYDVAAGEHFDLSPVREAIDDLREDVTALYELVDAGDVDPETANESLKALSRALVRVDRTAEGKYEQDPAVERPPYPGLAPAADLDEMAEGERKKQLVALRRQRNRAVGLLRHVRKALP